MVSTAPLDAAPRGDSATLDARILDAVLSCVARWGVAKTTVEDIATEARCSRATVYRVFPGGKDALLSAAARREVGRFFAMLDDTLRATDTLEELLTAGLVGAATFLADHEALAYLAERERAFVLPFIAFDRIDPLLATVRAAAGPHLERFCDPPTAGELAEWATRMVLTHLSLPSAHFDLTDPDDARRLAHRYLLPAFSASAATA